MGIPAMFKGDQPGVRDAHQGRGGSGSQPLGLAQPVQQLPKLFAEFRIIPCP